VGTPLIVAFCRLLDEMDKTPDGSGIRPETFLAAFSKTVPYMDVFTQNDMHEAFIALWNRMNEEVCISIGKGAVPYAVVATDTPLLSKLRAKCDTGWWSMLGKEYSPLVDSIYGQQIVQIECGGCRYIHHNYQPFNVLEVPIPIPNSSQESVSLTDCMHAAFRSEKLNAVREQDMWKCSKCGASVESEKTTHLWRAPPVLIVCLKRFVPHMGRLQKNDTRVAIPDNLRMHPLAQTTNDRPIQYKLKAIGHHMGNMTYGHYFATCLLNGQWMVVNDMSIREVGTPAERARLAERSSYMLFYEC
jgi:ubiquitin C-terminal hydrolase